MTEVNAESSFGVDQLKSSLFDVPDEDLDGEDLDLSTGDNYSIGSNPVIENQQEQSRVLVSSVFLSILNSLLSGHLGTRHCL